MLNFLILFAIILAFFDCYFNSKRIRESLLKALLVNAVSIVFSTEILNVCFKINFVYILGFLDFTHSFPAISLIKTRK